MASRVLLIRRPVTSRGGGGRPRNRGVAAALLATTVLAHQVAAVEIFPLTPPATVEARPVAPDQSLPPAVLADFTRRIQPLVINRCAAGACHGSAESPAPRFVRPHPGAGITPSTTQANLRAFIAALGPDRTGTRLAELLAAGHPTRPASPRLVAAPFSPAERSTLAAWLETVQLAERQPILDSAVRPATATASTEPNRFRGLLEAAANPPELPPPQEPRGVIFPRDVPPDE